MRELLKQYLTEKQNGCLHCYKARAGMWRVLYLGGGGGYLPI